MNTKNKLTVALKTFDREFTAAWRPVAAANYSRLKEINERDMEDIAFLASGLPSEREIVKNTEIFKAPNAGCLRRPC